MTKNRKAFAYLAAPLFNPMERAWNASLAQELAPYLDLFLPQRDGLLLRDLLSDGMDPKKAKRLIFNADMGAIHDADLVLAVLDGRTIDEGVSFEVGAAYALGKRCIGIKTDDRRMLQAGDNPMIECALECVVSSVSDLITLLNTFEEQDLFNLA